MSGDKVLDKFLVGMFGETPPLTNRLAWVDYIGRIKEKVRMSADYNASTYPKGHELSPEMVDFSDEGVYKL